MVGSKNSFAQSAHCTEVSLLYSSLTRYLLYPFHISNAANTCLNSADCYMLYDNFLNQLLI